MVAAGPVRSLALAPDNRSLITADGASVHVWDLATQKHCYAVSAPEVTIEGLYVSPDGSRATTSLADATLLVWDLKQARRPDRLLTKEPNAQTLEKLWTDLGSPDASQAQRAIWTLGEFPQQAVTAMKERLRATPIVEQQRLARLIADLDNSAFAVRSQATRDLEKLGVLAGPALRKALAAKPSLEVRQRVEQLLSKLDGPVTSSETLQFLRALEVLEHFGTEEARKILSALAKGAPEALLTQEAQASLSRMATSIQRYDER
jgi:hypothetical protein